MISDHPELIKKHVLESSDELNFHLRDLKQWEAEIKANDRQLIQDGQRREVEETEELTMPAVRNDSQKSSNVNDEKWTKKSKEKTMKRDDNTDDYADEVDEQRLKQQAILEKDKGNSFLKMGELDEAIECYTKGQQMDPYNPLLPANRALAFLKKEQFASAEEDCDLAISMDPNYVKVYQRRATARLALLKFDQAKADFLEVLRLEPQNKEARNQLIKIEKILTENGLETLTNTYSSCILPVHKEPHLRSKVELRRVEVLDIASQSVTYAEPTVPVIQHSVEIRNTDLAEKRIPDLPKPPQTSYEFQTELRRLKAYPELIYEYIKEIPCERYAQFFQHNLESESLSQMFSTFRDYYMWNNDDMYEPLFNLSQTKRFNMLKMFFSENDRQVLKEIFDHMSQTHAYSMENLKSLKQYYEI